MISHLIQPIGIKDTALHLKHKNNWRAMEVPNNIMNTDKNTNDSANKIVIYKI